jgi:microcompartment protein CcmK/EutM
MLDKPGADREPAGGHVIAIDTVGAGYGETVIRLEEGNGARRILG